MGTWVGGIIEKNFDKIMLFCAMNIWLVAVIYFYVKGADDKVLFFAFGAVNNLIGALLILCNVRRAGQPETPVTSGAVTEATTTIKTTESAQKP